MSQGRSSAPPKQSIVVKVPFLGCASDGQMGSQATPKGKPKAVAIPPLLAQRLAYYKAEYGVGVLAPRGWHCFSIYGSNGSNLFVSPDLIEAKQLFSGDWKGFSGPIVLLSVSEGGTSGRFDVAKVVARVFPAYSSFVQGVIAESINPTDSFPSGPYPKDKLKYRSKNVVEFETPAYTDGLGTQLRLQKNASSIMGVAMVVEGDMDLLQVSARLLDADRLLAKAIVKDVEDEASHAGEQ